MFWNGDTYYTEEHSISFGDLVSRTSDGQTYVDFDTIANTWEDWHLIPSSRPSVAHPTISTKFVEVPGSDGMLDLTTYLTGKPIYGQRQGSFSFQVANGFEHWETIRQKIVTTLHGKRLKMRLMDDPNHYYEGRFTVGQWDTGASNSTISISYQLDPYKMRISLEGSAPVLWDPFNFETDYDYSVIMSDPIGAGTYDIYADDFAFTPVATWVSGTPTITFGGVTRTLSSAGSVTLGPASSGRNTLAINGYGSVNIVWRKGAL